MLSNEYFFSVDTNTQHGGAFTLKDRAHPIVCSVGEWLTIGGPGTLVAFVGDDPSVVESLEANRIVFAKTGRHSVRASSGLVSEVLGVLVCDARSIDRVHVAPVPGVSTEGLKRRVLRELGRWEPDFNGSLESLMRFNLCNYGADPHPPPGSVPAF